MTIVYSPLESEFGFKSPSFTVDNQGNISANNLTLSGALTMTSGVITLADLRISGTKIDSIGTTTLTVGNTTGLTVGSVVTSTFIPSNKVVTIESIDSLTSFTVAPAIYMPNGASVTVTDPDTETSVNLTIVGPSSNTGDIEFGTPNTLFNGDVTVLQTVNATQVNTPLIKNQSGFVKIESVNAPIELRSNQRTKIINGPLNLVNVAQEDIDNLLASEGDIVFNTDTLDINYYTGTVSGWRSVSTGDIRFNGATITAGTGQDVSITPQGAGKVNIGKNLNVTGDVAISNLPTNSNHATRKDYVDRQITALAIALGS